MNDSLAFRLAQAAAAFDTKLRRLGDDIAPERLQMPASPWAWLDRLADPLARRSAVVRLYRQFIAPWPSLDRLLERHARIALLGRSAQWRTWCMLALAARPGVLRCCVAKEPRRALRETLGSAFEPLMSVSARGRATTGELAAWTPAHWACAGYLDWCTLLAPDDAALRELAVLSLPPALMGVEAALAAVPADLPPAHAVKLIDELGLEWSC
jgi:hypothetical protein